MLSVPESITDTQLAQIIDLPDSRIYIPMANKYLAHYALIDDFANEEEANEFAHQWSNSSSFNKTIKCIVVAPDGNETDGLHSSGKSQFNKEMKGTQAEQHQPPTTNQITQQVDKSGKTF